MHARKLLAGLATTAVTLSALALSAGPASAVYTQDPDDPGFTPIASDLIGVGSDTTMHAMHLLGAAWNAETPAPSFRIASYSALGGGTLPLPGGEVNRPNGSGSGKTVLYNPSNPDVDFARSSSANSPAETSAGLQMFPFALDTLRMAVSNNVTSHAPAALTKAQIVDIYKGNITNWSEVGGTPGVIAPKTPQPGSGTRSFWDGQLKAMNGGVTVTYGASVVEVQEHDDATIKGDANAIAPFSEGRSALLGTTLRLLSADPTAGWKADRAVYNVVRGADLGRADIQAVFGPEGFVCSTEARPLIEEAGFKQFASEADGGVCGVATQEATSNFLLNERVVTTTKLAVTSTSAGTAKLVATVTGSTSPSGTVSFFQGETPVKENVGLISGQATTTVTGLTPGAVSYRAVFNPTADSPFEGSEATGAGVVKTSSAISESFPAKVKAGKKATGAVTVALSGVSAKATGTVKVLAGAKTLASGKLSGGKVTLSLKKLKTGVNKLKVVWAGDSAAVGSQKAFTVKVLKKKK